MRSAVVCLVCLSVPGIAVRAQSGGGPAAFEAASVRRSDPKAAGSPANVCRGGPGTSDPGLLVCTNAALSMLVCRAWDLQFYQLVSPDWMFQGGSDAGYDVRAVIPAGTTVDQFRVMFQNLLTERFHLAIHSETRQLPRYSLKADKAAPGLRHSPGPAPPGPRFTQTVVNGRVHYSQHNTPLKFFASFLTTQLRAPVEDETGLAGDYDFGIEFIPDERWRGFQPGSPTAESDPAPDLVFAVRNQLGLKLETKKGPLEVIVVDSADKTPVAN